MNEIAGFSTIEHIADLPMTSSEGLPVTTSFRNLNSFLHGGFHEGDLIVLGGVPGVGKSDFVLNLALNASSASLDSFSPDRKVALFSLQNSRHNTIQRILSIQSDYDLSRMSDLYRIQWAYPHATKAADQLSNAPLYINYDTNLDFDELRAKTLQLSAEVGVDLVLVDSIQRIKPPQNHSRQPTTLLPELMKALAQELNRPILVVTQLTRAIEKRVNQRPKLSDLMGGRIVEDMADVVLLMQQTDWYEDPDQNPDNWLNFTMDAAKIIIAKNRNGPTGEDLLRYNRQTGNLKTIPHLDWQFNEVIGYMP